MDAERIVIVGAGPAGLSTARSYRACGGRRPVTLVGEEPALPYERPPLTKELLWGEMEASELPIERAEWFAEQGIELMIDTVAESIDPARGLVRLRGDRELEAGAIVLASGSEPTRPPVPGADHEGVLTLRRLTDSQRVLAGARPGEPVLVIGTGFIGCELAASLAMRGSRVTLIGEERLPQARRLGEAAARRIAGWLEGLGVELIGGASIAAVEEGCRVALEDERRLEASLIVLATGVRPRGELAERAGLPLRDGAVLVDAAMRSEQVPSVLAVGDVACARNELAGRHLRVEHWGDALVHGEVAGRALARGQASWRSVPGFWSSIGRRVLKYAAWGEDYDEARLSAAAEEGPFTVWYAREGATVGVLTHERDEDYERGRELIAKGAPPP